MVPAVAAQCHPASHEVKNGVTFDAWTSAQHHTSCARVGRGFRHREGRLGGLDEEGQSWLSEASELCRTYGFKSWIPQIDELAASQPPTTPMISQAIRPCWPMPYLPWV